MSAFSPLLKLSKTRLDFTTREPANTVGQHEWLWYHAGNAEEGKAMPDLDYSLLDREDISMNSFYPRPHWTPTPEGAQDHAVTVAEDINLSCRFFPVGRANPTILFFYGNGETAASYDDIARFYCQIGVNFFIADYRGYGGSGGFPTFSTMLSDAHLVLAYLEELLAQNGFTGPFLSWGGQWAATPPLSWRPTRRNIWAE